MDITAVETYQSLYGAMRTGDVAALRSRVQFYTQRQALLRRHSKARFRHAGAICQYETNPWGTCLYGDGHVLDGYTEKGNPWVRYSWQGNLWMLHTMCDYAALSGDQAFADKGLRLFAQGVLTFFQAHYPRQLNGKRVFFPSEAGEMWSGVTDAAELIAALRTIIPRLLTMGRERAWPALLLAEWEKFLAAVPELPRGRFELDLETRKGRILKGKLLVPARDISKTDPPNAINRQHTELYSLWPAKLMLRTPQDRAVARQSYEARYYQHITTGWALDAVFAACLGLDKDLDEWFDFHFDHTCTFPCGLAQEESPNQAAAPHISQQPSMQGLGTVVIPVLERLMQDYPDRLIVLPCWPQDVPVRFRLFSPYAGWVEVDYRPGRPLRVQTEKKIRICVRPEWQKQIIVSRHRAPSSSGDEVSGHDDGAR